MLVGTEFRADAGNVGGAVKLLREQAIDPIVADGWIEVGNVSGKDEGGFDVLLHVRFYVAASHTAMTEFRHGQLGQKHLTKQLGLHFTKRAEDIEDRPLFVRLGGIEQQQFFAPTSSRLRDLR